MKRNERENFASLDLASFKGYAMRFALTQNFAVKN
jgi:hypothetical protein